jgi:hypothetical protein
MNDDGGEKVIDMSSKFSIDALIKNATARAAENPNAEAEPGDDPDDGANGVPSLEKLAPLPRPGDPYKAIARPASKPLSTLHLIKADGTIWSYPYSCRVEGPHLVYADDAAKTLVVVLKFSGLVGTEVTLSGRKLEQMVNFLGHHRIAWVREQAKGKIAKDGEGPVITGIHIKTLER